MKINEFRDLSNEELERRVEELKKELFNLRFQTATGQVDNYARIGEVKKGIARAKTVLRERELKLDRNIIEA
jgi:large subunit ribosomal protein L29